MSEGKRKYLWLVVALVVIVAGYAYLRVRQSRASDKVTYETTKVDRGRIVAKVTASGTLSAIVTVQVGSQVSGRIAALYADYNSAVRKGELIAKIDPQLFQAAVAQARANLVAAQGNLAKAKAQAIDAERQYKRNQTLAARKLIAQADLDTSQATYDADQAAVQAAEGQVEQAKAQLNSTEVNLAYTDIVSPTDGTVIARNVDVGQTVAASLQAPTLFLIAEDLRKMQVDTSVAEADIGKIQTAMKASFTVDAYPNDKFVGVVRQVRKNPQTVQNVVTYDAVIDVANPDLKLMPGMTANCTFVWAERDDALRVPNAALRFRPSPEVLARLNGGVRSGQRAGGPNAEAAQSGAPAMPGSSADRTDPTRHSVWVLRNGKPERVVIRTGVSDGSLTEVAEGALSEGDLVITDMSGGGTGQQGAFPRRMF